jgi:hypothetical protein
MGSSAGESTERAMPDGQDDRRWTVMVFMGANTVGRDAPLIEAAKDDIKEMTAVGSGETLDIFVQVHGDGVPRRHHIGVDDGLPVPEEQRDTRDGRALSHFIRTSLLRPERPHRQQDHSMLVLWGHAYDFAIDRTVTRDGTIDALDFVRLSEVLGGLQDEIKAAYRGQERPRLDIVAFDACDVATVELACQLQPFASYLLGSQIGVPIPGWPYDRILERLRCPKGRLMGPAEFGTFAVRRFCRAYAPEHRTVSMTLLDLQRASELFARSEVLATALDLALDRGTEARSRLAEIFARSQTADYKPFVDVADLCLTLVRESGDPLVQESAVALGDFLLAPLPEGIGESVAGVGVPFVVECGRNSGATAKLNGVSIYAPHVAPMNDFESVEGLYGRFRFASETRWGRLVHNLARSQ